MRDPEFHDHPDLPLRVQMDEAKPQPKFWRRAARGMEVVIYLLLVVALTKLFGPELDRQDELRAEVDRLERIAGAKAEKAADLRQEHRLLKTDKDYLETIARDRLDLQRDGEFIIRIDRGEDEED